MDIIEQTLNEISEIDHQLINNIKLAPESHEKRLRGCKQAVYIEIQINGKPSELLVGFPELFPNELPKFFDENNQFGFIPHKEPDGFICFTKSESLIIDVRYPGSILLNCLLKVIEVIENGVKGLNTKDFTKEFEVYWSRQSNVMDLYAHIDTSNKLVRLLDLFQFVTGDKRLVIAGERNAGLSLPLKQLFHLDIKNGKRSRCLYFPLKRNTFLKPPQYNDSWDYSTVKENILSNLTKDNMNRFRKLLQNSDIINSQFEFVIIGIPIDDDNMVLFGYEFQISPAQVRTNRRKHKVPIPRIHPLIQRPREQNITPLNINRWHPNHLLNRTGGSPGLTDKTVIVVGAGSVGSEIAMRAAKAGLKKLLIVDYDFMSMDNIHRHALGTDKVFRHYKDGIEPLPKVLGLKEEINKKFPFTQVEIVIEDFIKAYEEDKIDLNEADLIYVSIGSPNQEMVINRIMQSLPKPVPVIYTWVEPLGIGGHALVTLNKKREGCYQCLFKPYEDEPIYNISAFAEPFQDFSKSITGCGSNFTPYSFLDSERTAILAMDVGLRVLTGLINDNPLFSWKGDSQVFYDQGYQTTPRFELSTEALNETKLKYKDINCPVCSKEVKHD
jgi:molybdopterin-synthase adenylyltransferase